MSAHHDEVTKTRRPESLQEECDRVFQEHYQEVDRFHLERLCQRYRDLVPPERIRAVKDLPTVFEDRRHFEQSCVKGHVESGEVDQTVGFSTGLDRPAHVDTDYSQWRKTAIHERLHQMSDRHVEQHLGERLDEGITEDLAIRELGSQWNPELPRSYPEERAMAQKARELCGERAVDRAYFQGDVRELRACLDDRLGEGSLDKLKDMADCSPEFRARETTERLDE